VAPRTTGKEKSNHTANTKARHANNENEDHEVGVYDQSLSNATQKKKKNVF